MDQIILFGDSITQGSFEPGKNGIGQRLAHLYARKLDVINRGFSGYNAKWALPVFKQIFPPAGAQARLLVIWFGANDSCLPPSPQYIPLDEFITHLNSIVAHTRSTSPHTSIILITPPPMSEAMRGADLGSRDPPLPLDRRQENTKAYAQAVKEVGMMNGLPVVDAFDLMWEGADKIEGNLERYLTDGLHLTADGYELIYKGLVDTLESHFPGLAADRMGFVFVPWAEIDWHHPEGSLGARRN